MRYLACTTVDCVNNGAPYFDFEPDEKIVLCPHCGKAMAVTTLAAIEEAAAAKAAAYEAEQEKLQAAAELEAAAAPAAPAPAKQPLEQLTDYLETLPAAQPVTAAELLTALRPATSDAPSTVEAK